LPLAAQVRLFKVLQNKEIERVGGVKTIPFDIRVVAATNRNLEEMVKLIQFREDLWFRLNVFPIWIPPLRERRSDIPTLLQHFISLKSRKLKLPVIPTVTTGATDRLLDYHWPGNIRELQNVVERELILNPTGPLSFSNLEMSLQDSSDIQPKHQSQTDNLDELTRQHIRRVLKKVNGRIHGKGGAADLLGIRASTLRNRINIFESLIISFFKFFKFLCQIFMTQSLLSDECKALIMAIFTRIAFSLFKTLDIIETLCSVNADGGTGLNFTVSGRLSQLLISSFQSSLVNFIRKSPGKRLIFLLTACLRVLVSTSYNSARSKSNMIFCPRKSYILL